MSDALNIQIDGTHYKELKMQPLELAYLVGGTPCFTKLAKYSTRDKGDRMINLDKAIHCIQIEEQLSNNSRAHILECYPLLRSDTRRDQAEMVINIFTDDPFVQSALKAMLYQRYDLAVAEIEALKTLINDKK